MTAPAGGGPTDAPLAEVLAAGYEPDFVDDFDAPGLDRTRWLPHYLPQWSSSARSAARYRLADGCLHLRVEADQPPWCPELDGDTRVSSLQTGVYAGPPGSTVGQHRFHPRAVVREAQSPQRLYTPRYGAFVLRARAEIDRDGMVALWMIGYEDTPDRSGEICVFEAFGSESADDHARIGMGVHPFGDPILTDDFAKVDLPLDLREFHEYAAEWTPRHVTFHVDGRPVRTVAQSPDYPMQLMLGVYHFGAPSPTREGVLGELVVDRVAAYRPKERSGARAG